MGDTGVAKAARRGAVLLAALLLALIVLPAVAHAHPLGNLSVNTFSRLVIEADQISLDVVVDAAEIPTLQAFPDVNRRRGDVPRPQRLAFERDRCAGIRDDIDLSVGATAVALDVVETAISFPEGSAGLRTSRLTCTLVSSNELRTVDASIDYRITANADRVGWREVIAVPSGVVLASSDVPQTSLSDGLTRYPQDLLSSPPDQREAHLSVQAGSSAPAGPLSEGASGVVPRGLDRFTSAFTDLVARQDLTLGFGLLAFLAAVALGALHAFAPGHGKTIMAAYLVGRQGSFRSAAVVGLSVTATHTLGVLALGIVLTGVGLASPERVYPWLGTVSGVLLMAIGVGLLLRHRRSAVHEPAPAETSHHHHPHVDEVADPNTAHRHGMFTHTHLPPASNLRGLVAIGFAGGLVPSPSALLVLLGGIALGRTWFGVLLVVAYGIGMAGALIAAGLLMVTARDAIGRFLEGRSSHTSRRMSVLLGRALPSATAGVVVVVGLGIALRSAAQI